MKKQRLLPPIAVLTCGLVLACERQTTEPAECDAESSLEDFCGEASISESSYGVPMQADRVNGLLDKLCTLSADDAVFPLICNAPVNNEPWVVRSPDGDWRCTFGVSDDPAALENLCAHDPAP